MAKIPKIIHFFYGLQEDLIQEDFPLVYYLAIKSAHQINQPDVIHFYTYQSPFGVWWEQAKRYVEVIPTTPPEEIFGKKLVHPAHRADVMRLLVLLKWGGIYLDLDTICVKPFDDLLNHSFVIGQQGTGFYLEGLGNAVLLAKKEAGFAQAWLSTYKTFRSTGVDEHWDEHSVKIPLQLATFYAQTEEVHIEPFTSFFNPHYRFGIEKLFESCHLFPHAYCHHLWESISWQKYLRHLTPEYIFAHDSTYNVLAREILMERQINTDSRSI